MRSKLDRPIYLIENKSHHSNIVIFQLFKMNPTVHLHPRDIQPQRKIQLVSLLPLYKLGRTERSFHHRSRPFSLFCKSLLKTRTNLNLEKMAFTTSEITIDDSSWRRKTHTVSHPKTNSDRNPTESTEPKNLFIFTCTSRWLWICCLSDTHRSDSIIMIGQSTTGD